MKKYKLTWKDLSLNDFKVYFFSLFKAFIPKSKITISTLNDRKDTSLVTSINLKGDINQLIPFLKKINKDNNIFYTLSFKESNVNSNISSYEVKRSFKTMKISKRINFND